MPDLCSVAEVRQFLQKPSGETQSDAILGALITRASAAVERIAQREFTPTAAATREFVWRHGDVLDLAPYDLRTVTSITLDTDDTPTTLLTTADYRLRPKPNKDGVYQWVEFRNHSLTNGERELTIVGDWGFTTVPAEAKQATIVTVADWFRERVAAFGTRFNPETEQFETPELLPSGALALLRPLKRIII